MVMIFGLARYNYRIFITSSWLVDRCGRSTYRVEGRCYGCSPPVKYIPVKSRKGNESNSLRYEEVRTVESAVSSRANHSRNLSDFEPRTHDAGGSSSASLDWLNSEIEEELDVNLLTGDNEFIEQGYEKVGNMQGNLEAILPDQHQDAEKLAIELLASRACTAHELKKKLQGKRVPLKIIDAVISDFKTRGLINDCLYAETYSRSKWSSSCWGPSRIKQGLFKKGVTAADADKAIKLVFNDGGDHDPGIGLSRLSVDQLYLQASKQWKRSTCLPLERRKSRIMHWLQYRGFNWAVIGYLLKKLDAESPS